MDIITIGTCSDGWFSLKVASATINYFELKSDDMKDDQVILTLIRVAPYIMKLDGEMMEAYDSPRNLVTQYYVDRVVYFSKHFTFRNVDCALPGFDDGKHN